MNHTISLKGIWRFAFDPYNEGLDQKWMLEENQPYLDNKMRSFIPGYWKNSIISSNLHDFALIGWYWRKITIKKFSEDPYYLLIDGVHDSIDLFIDGINLGHFYSGGIPLKINIDKYLKSSEKDYFFAFRVSVESQSEQYPKMPLSYELGGFLNSLSISSQSQILMIEKSLNIRFNRNSISNKINYVELEFNLYFENKSSKEFNGFVLIEITRDFVKVTHKKHKINILASNTRMVHLILTIDHDKIDLWDLENPNFYNLAITLSDQNFSSDSSPIYSYKTQIGLREIQIDPDGKILLNSTPIKPKIQILNVLSGENLPFCGEIEIINWLKSKKNEGFNIIRSTDFILPKIYYEIATRIGLLIEATLPIVNASDPEIIQHISDYVFKINFYPSICGFKFLSSVEEFENINEIQSKMKSAANKLDSNIDFI